MPSKDQMRASHILVNKYQKATDILEQVKSNSGKFADLAKQFSECPSKKKGGDLGFFSKHQMVPEFEKAVLSLKIGELYSEPVKTKFGYHIIKRTG